jgi:hypothetical protein
MRQLILVAALVLAGACGDDDDGTDGSDVIDASGGGEDDSGTSEDIDAGGGGTQDVNQFCETLEDGPYCITGLECCEDKVCRHAGDCPGGKNFIPCDCTDECPTGICCDVDGEMESFCTKRSACNDYDGVEDTTCP